MSEQQTTQGAQPEQPTSQTAAPPVQPATPTQAPAQAAPPSSQPPATVPVVFQLAPPVQQPAAAVQPAQPAAQPAPAEDRYKSAVERFAAAALGNLPETQQGMIKRIAGDDPARQLDVYAELQSSGVLGATAPAPVATPATPSAPPQAEAQSPANPETPTAPPNVDRDRAGGSEPKPPPPKTPEQASRNLARALKGKTLQW